MSIKSDHTKRLMKRADDILKRNKHTPAKQYADTDKAMRLLLGLGSADRVDETHIRECERTLKLPRIRLYLDRATPFSSVKGRRLRIFKAMHSSHPHITRHCVMRTR